MRWTSRLGDASVWNETGEGGRPCFTTQLYADAARRMRDAFGAKRVFLATDSDEAARELANLLDGDGMELTLIGFNRSLVGGSSAANVGKTVNRCPSH